MTFNDFLGHYELPVRTDRRCRKGVFRALRSLGWIFTVLYQRLMFFDGVDDIGEFSVSSVDTAIQAQRNDEFGNGAS